MTDLSGSKGTQVGDNNLQLNVFAGTERVRLHSYGPAPGLAESFQPRSELREVIAKGLTSGGAVLSQVVAAGNGGVGKTQLAAAVFHESNADLAVWVTATTRSTIVAGYAGIAAEIEPTWARLSLEKAAEQFLAWLRDTQQSWLVVLDDVADPADLRHLRPHGPAGAVLITTRRRDLRVGIPVDVDVFTPEESLAYLTQQLRTTGGQRSNVLDGADLLATDLGHLPVALSQAAAVVDFDGITCADYRAQHDLSSLRPTDDYAHPVARTWKAAIERADAMEPVGQASQALELAAVLDPNGIPQEVWTDQGDDMRRALRNLHALHLVTHEPNGGPTSVRIHALVQQAVLHVTAHTPEVVRHAADRLLAIWPTIEKDRPLSRSLRANTEALTAHAGLWQPAAHPVLAKSGTSLGKTGLAAEAVTYFDELGQTASRMLGSDHPFTLTTRGNLARWQGEAGDPAGAALAFQEVIRECHRVLGSDDTKTLIYRSHLAYWQGRSGDRAAAIEGLDELLVDCSRVFGPKHPGTLMNHVNLARWQGQSGDRSGAERLLHQVLADYLTVVGPDHHHTLVTRRELARLRGEGGEPAAAAKAFEDIVADYERILGADHPHTLATHSNLAHWRGEAGDVAAAVRGFEESLQRHTSILGPGHPHTIDAERSLEEWKARRGTP